MPIRPAILAAAFAALPASEPCAQPRELAELERVRLRSVTQGPVCPDPARPCTISGGPFKPNELSFRAPRRFAFDRGEDRSRPFYAVILRGGPLCGIEESHRLQAQALFPGRKVFVHRHMCEGFGDKVTYTNVDRQQGFMAVYAGSTEAEGKALLGKVRALGRFPDARLGKMQVVVTWQLE